MKRARVTALVEVAVTKAFEPGGGCELEAGMEKAIGEPQMQRHRSRHWRSPFPKPKKAPHIDPTLSLPRSARCINEYGSHRASYGSSEVSGVDRTTKMTTKRLTLLSYSEVSLNRRDSTNTSVQPGIQQFMASESAYISRRDAPQTRYLVLRHVRADQSGGTSSSGFRSLERAFELACMYFPYAAQLRHR